MKFYRGRIAAFLLGVVLAPAAFGAAFDIDLEGNPSLSDKALYAHKSGTTNTKQSLQSTDGALHVLSSGSGATAGQVQGTTAEDSPVANNPVQIGVEARTTSKTSVSNGDVVRPIASVQGVPASVQDSVMVDGSSNTIGAFIADDGTALRGIQAHPMVYNGATWDRARGDSTGGAWVQGPVAHDSPIAGNPVQLGVRAHDSPISTVSADDVARLLGDRYGHVFVRNDHLNRIRCTVTVSTATALTAVGGSCAAPGAGLSIYVTDISFDASASGIAADAFPTLKYGTGGTCSTGTTVFWGKLSAAAVAVNQSFATPIKIPANNEICWISSTAGSKFIVISGFIAP